MVWFKNFSIFLEFYHFLLVSVYKLFWLWVWNYIDRCMWAIARYIFLEICAKWESDSRIWEQFVNKMHSEMWRCLVLGKIRSQDSGSLFTTTCICCKWFQENWNANSSWEVFVLFCVYSHIVWICMFSVDIIYIYTFCPYIIVYLWFTLEVSMYLSHWVMCMRKKRASIAYHIVLWNKCENFDPSASLHISNRGCCPATFIWR